jgi:hypothetical protein
MSFLPNIPQPSDNISVSQGNILTNFQYLGATTGNIALGYYKLPNGLIIQWGQTTISSATSRVISFSQTYSTSVFSIQVTRIAARPSTNTPNGNYIQDTSITNSGFRIVNDDGISSGFYWFAIGL